MRWVDHHIDSWYICLWLPATTGYLRVLVFESCFNIDPGVWRIPNWQCPLAVKPEEDLETNWIATEKPLSIPGCLKPKVFPQCTSERPRKATPTYSGASRKETAHEIRQTGGAALSRRFPTLRLHLTSFWSNIYTAVFRDCRETISITVFASIATFNGSSGRSSSVYQSLLLWNYNYVFFWVVFEDIVIEFHWIPWQSVLDRPFSRPNWLTC